MSVKIRFILVLGCIIGAIAYMASVSNKRELEKRVQNYQTENTMRQIQKQQQERENEIQRQKMDEENADNAEYQVNRWYNKYVRLKEKSVLTFRMTRPQISQLKRDMEEAEEKLLYWINEREKELAEKRDKAVAEGNTVDVDYYNNEIEKLSRKADVIDEDDNDNDNE
ncbi:MAG: hypothetical protein II856_02685 [Bacteroidales bacterium]|nr:hypothetical protein [Bacteroidales bacterium]